MRDIDDLAEGLNAPSASVRIMAVIELADPGRAAFLEDYRDDADPDVRKNVRWALDKIVQSSAQPR